MTDRPIIFSAPMVRALLDGRKTQTRRLLKLRGCRGFSEFGPSDTKGYDWHFRDAGMRWHDVRDARLKELLPWAVGDRLWTRENFCIVRETLDYETGGEAGAYDWDAEHGDPKPYLNGDARGGLRSAIYFPADGEDETPSEMWPCIGLNGKLLREKEIPWRPSIHMPRWASRLTLTVTDVRLQRLQDMEGQHPLDSDAIAEGVHQIHHGDGDFYYSALRDEPHPKNWIDPTDAFRELWEKIHGTNAWAANPWIVALTFTVALKNIDA